MLDTLRKAFAVASHTRRSRWVVLVVLAVVASVVEAVGAVMVFSLLALVAAPGGKSPVADLLARLFPSLDGDGLLVATVGTIAAFFLGRAVLLTVQSYLQNRVTQNAGVALSSRLLRGHLSLPYSLHVQRSSSELLRNVFTSVNDLIAYAWIPAITLLSDGLMVLALAVVLLVTAPVATGVTVVVLGLTVLVLLRFAQPRLRQLGGVVQESATSTYAALQQAVDGLRDIKLTGSEDHFEGIFTAGRVRFARAQTGRAVLTDLPRVALETTLMLFILVFLLVTTVPGDGAPDTDALAVLGLFGYAVIRLLPSINRSVANLNSLRFGTAAVDNVFADIELIDSFEPKAGDAVLEPLPFRDAITFEDVTFRYDGVDVDALSGFSTRIARGESVGVVGSTGAGKTTLLDLLVGLLEPTTGTIKVDGHDITEAPRRWQLDLGVVPQTLFLVDDTLRRNIALGLADPVIDEDRLGRAVETAQLSEFVDSLPLGLDTVVGERGVRLSGGQRQRIAIARAVYRDPRVLVFDEGTSALDMLTESKLVAALADVGQDRTVVIVAHRLTTVRDCDRILVLEHGRLVDAGTYDELLSRSSTFRDLAGDPRGAA